MEGEEVVVELSVGGSPVTTLQSTLTLRPGSRLARVFAAAPFPLPRDGHDRYVIDRDPQAFCVLLNYLRLYKAAQVWETALPKDPDRLALLTQEADYWGLHFLRDAAIRLLRSSSDPTDAGYFNQVIVESKSFHLDLSKEAESPEVDHTRVPIYIPTESFDKDP